MAHYALLDKDNIVVEVIVGVDENELVNEQTPETYYAQLKGYKCIRTSYNNKIRKQFAGIGYFYDEKNDVFISPRPFNSWFLNENFDWIAPKLKPDGIGYYWDEELGDWVNGKTL